VDVVIILEFCYWKEVILVVLLFVYKDIEVLVQLLVDIFHLSIHLRMPSSRGDQFYSKKPTEFLDEEYNELQTSV